MSDPKRLIDPHSGAHEPLRTLLRAGRAELPETERMEKLEARLGALIAAGGGAAGAASGGAGAGAALGHGTALAVKIGAAVVVAATVGGGIVVERHRRTEPKLALPTAVVASATKTVAPVPTKAQGSAPGSSLVGSVLPTPSGFVAAAPTPSSQASVRTRATTVTRALEPRALEPLSAPLAPPSLAATVDPPFVAPSTDPPHDSEITLLQAAQADLRVDPDSALRLADRHAALFPAGMLAQEREVIAIEALLKLRRPDEARDRASRFSQNYPQSAHRTRIQSLLKAGPDETLHNP